jgi:hypothetical protein
MELSRTNRPSPGEQFSETNDNSVAILLIYGKARILLAGDAEARSWSTAQRFVHEALSGGQSLKPQIQPSQGFVPG